MNKKNTNTTIIIGFCAIVGWIVISWLISAGLYWLVCYGFGMEFTFWKATAVWAALHILKFMMPPRNKKEE